MCFYECPRSCGYAGALCVLACPFEKARNMDGVDRSHVFIPASSLLLLLLLCYVYASFPPARYTNTDCRDRMFVYPHRYCCAACTPLFYQQGSHAYAQMVATVSKCIFVCIDIAAAAVVLNVSSFSAKKAHGERERFPRPYESSLYPYCCCCCYYCFCLARLFSDRPTRHPRTDGRHKAGVA